MVCRVGARAGRPRNSGYFFEYYIICVCYIQGCEYGCSGRKACVEVAAAARRRRRRRSGQKKQRRWVKITRQCAGSSLRTCARQKAIPRVSSFDGERRRRPRLSTTTTTGGRAGTYLWSYPHPAGPTGLLKNCNVVVMYSFLDLVRRLHSRRAEHLAPALEPGVGLAARHQLRHQVPLRRACSRGRTPGGAQKGAAAPNASIRARSQQPGRRRWGQGGRARRQCTRRAARGSPERQAWMRAGEAATTHHDPSSTSLSSWPGPHPE